MEDIGVDNQPIKDSMLIEQITSMINRGEYADAVKVIQQRLSSGLDVSKQRDAILEVTLAGFLIDIGEEGGIEQAVLEGLRIHEQDYRTLKRFVKEVSLQYNIGNGKITLFKIRRRNPDFEFRPSVIDLLTEAKNHYWKAFKLLQPEDEALQPQLLVNLANTLSTSCRVVEALQYFDLALQQFPDFPKANSNRSEALLWLNHPPILIRSICFGK